MHVLIVLHALAAYRERALDDIWAVEEACMSFNVGVGQGKSRPGATQPGNNHHDVDYHDVLCGSNSTDAVLLSAIYNCAQEQDSGAAPFNVTGAWHPICTDTQVDALACLQSR
jgi:hypothetical protein